MNEAPHHQGGLPLSEIDRRIADRLAGNHVRYTRARRHVVGVLSASEGPLSAADVCDKAAAVPLSSVYRTLTVFDGAGVVDRSHDADGVARYELAEWLSGHHHHLVCIECGSTVDFDANEASELQIKAIADAVGQAAGFEVTGHRLDVEGRCQGCRT